MMIRDSTATQPQPRVPHRLTHLGPGAEPPLGGAGVAVAGPPGLGPVVVAVLVVDDPRAVVVQRLHAADRAHLHPGLAAGLAAVLPLLRHPAAGGRGTERGEHTCEWPLAACRSLIGRAAYMGGGQGFWLQSRMSARGFRLDLLQKLLLTILLSTFLLQPYRRYCFPAETVDLLLCFLTR